MFANLMDERDRLEGEISQLLKQVVDADVRLQLRQALQKQHNLIELAILGVDVEPKSIPLPPPPVYPLLPAKVPERPDMDNDFVRVREAAKVSQLTHWDAEAEKTRAHYRRNPHIALREAEKWGVSVGEFVEMMCRRDWHSAVPKKVDGLYGETDEGGRMVVFPGEFVYMG